MIPTFLYFISKHKIHASYLTRPSLAKTRFGPFSRATVSKGKQCTVSFKIKLVYPTTQIIRQLAYIINLEQHSFDTQGIITNI